MLTINYYKYLHGENLKHSSGVYTCTLTTSVWATDLKCHDCTQCDDVLFHFNKINVKTELEREKLFMFNILYLQI